MTETASILVVDDTPANIDVLVDLLKDYNVAVALDGTSALEIVHAQKIDLILLDIVMPDPDGLAVCKSLKHDPNTSNIPIIFITAKTDESSIEAAYDAGGDDYVSKPFKPREILARVRLQLERVTYLKQLEFLASRDPMTGIYNRRKFFELAQHCFANGDDRLMIGAILDIDHFKKINDTYGHPAGDEVIRRISAVIVRQLPPTVIFGRIGGEEFGFAGRFADKADAITLFQQCRRSIEQLSIVFEDHHIRCTVSNGMACRNDRLDTLDKLLAEADQALYDAKGGGRNTLIVRT